MPTRPGAFFRSLMFKPYLPDECQEAPGLYGAELAYWLSRKLAEKGINTSYPDHEHSGWHLTYINPDGEEFFLGCVNVSASEEEWHCFIDPKSPGFFEAKPPVHHALPLCHALKQILEAEPSISEIRWTGPLEC